MNESVNILVTDKNGNIKQQSRSRNSQENKRKNKNDPSSSKTEVKWFFNDYIQKDHPQKEVVEICREFLDLVGDFVDKVHKKFP
ncbi:MAG: hypothetical protein WCF23_23045 [Candidatus Nitrosopolaris sp.]